MSTCHKYNMVVPGQCFHILRGKRGGYKTECGGSTSTQLVICRSVTISDIKHWSDHCLWVCAQDSTSCALLSHLVFSVNGQIHLKQRVMLLQLLVRQGSRASNFGVPSSIFWQFLLCSQSPGDRSCWWLRDWASVCNQLHCGPLCNGKLTLNSLKSPKNPTNSQTNHC